MSDILIRFVKTRNINIISDGDLDGVFATGLLLRGIKLSGVPIDDSSIFFPRARERKGLEVANSILVELRPDRGLIYKGYNILIDHHPEPPMIAMYKDSRPILKRKYNLDSSVAGLVHYVFEDVLDVPPELVVAVDAVDYKRYDVLLARDMARAFLISRNIPNRNLRNVFANTISMCDRSSRLYKLLCDLMAQNSIYGYLVLAIVEGLWDNIYDWLREESIRYENRIYGTVKKLYNRKSGDSKISWVIYNYGDIKERTAIDDVLYDLQKESEIAFIVGITGNGFLVRVTTFNSDIDLNSICWNLPSGRDIDCGGRRNVIGLYFPNRNFSLRGVIEIILNSIRTIK